jgi:hypothetical protein
VANNSPAKAGLVKGGSLGISIKGRRKPKKKKRQKQNQSKNKVKTQRKK